MHLLYLHISYACYGNQLIMVQYELGCFSLFNCYDHLLCFLPEMFFPPWLECLTWSWMDIHLLFQVLHVGTGMDAFSAE
jgi:hypothetical protein